MVLSVYLSKGVFTVKKILLTGLLFVLVASTAQARELPWPQWYIGLSGSLSLLNDSDISGTGVNGDASFNSGWGVSGAIGYRPQFESSPLNGMRFEIEAAYRTNDVDKFSGVAFGNGTSARNTAYMINALYDVDTGTQWIPYFGAGVGYSDIDFQSDSDMVFSYQFMAGVGYEPELIPNTIWSVGYRYFGTQDANLSRAGTRYDFEYSAHSVEAGLQMRF